MGLKKEIQKRISKFEFTSVFHKIAIILEEKHQRNGIIAVENAAKCILTPITFHRTKKKIWHNGYFVLK